MASFLNHRKAKKTGNAKKMYRSTTARIRKECIVNMSPQMSMASRIKRKPMMRMPTERGNDSGVRLFIMENEEPFLGIRIIYGSRHVSSFTIIYAE